jgi:hypothetical protein
MQITMEITHDSSYNNIHRVGNDEREGYPKEWSTVLVTAVGTWQGKSVLCGRKSYLL